MRILLLCHSFNSLTQRLYVELSRQGHELSVEFDIHDAVTEEAVRLFQPEVVLAPFLKRVIPASVWSRVPCLVVHPGIVGDQGPAALDWAITRPGWMPAPCWQAVVSRCALPPNRACTAAKSPRQPVRP
jgi:putative two-component system hydrogenase maturation factor HypX/HoxX